MRELKSASLKAHAPVGHCVMERIVKREQIPDYRAFSAIPSSLGIEPIST
jgi:hypothetical protein